MPKNFCCKESGCLPINEITYRLLQEADIAPDMLNAFVWRQEITREYRPRKRGGWRVVTLRRPRVEDKTREQLRAFVKWDLLPMVFGRRVMGHRGAVFGAYDGARLVGFAFLRDKLLGEEQLHSVGVLWVSADRRREGIGRELFRLCCEAARAEGAERLYISTNPAAETQDFYRALGCVDARRRVPEAGPKSDVPLEIAL